MNPPVSDGASWSEADYNTNTHIFPSLLLCGIYPPAEAVKVCRVASMHCLHVWLIPWPLVTQRQAEQERQCWPTSHWSEQGAHEYTGLLQPCGGKKDPFPSVIASQSKQSKWIEKEEHTEHTLLGPTRGCKIILLIMMSPVCLITKCLIFASDEII